MVSNAVTTAELEALTIEAGQSQSESPGRDLVPPPLSSLGLRAALARSKICSYFSPVRETKSVSSPRLDDENIVSLQSSTRRNSYCTLLSLLLLHSILCITIGLLLIPRIPFISNMTRNKDPADHIPHHELQPALARLHRLGFNPKTILDIGTSTGRFIRGVHKQFPESQIHGIDATDRIEEDAKRMLSSFTKTVLSDKEETVDWYATWTKSGTAIGGPGDSMFREKSTWYEKIKPERREAARLDHLIAGIGGGRTFDLIKIDVQGAEWKVLDGAKKVLKNVDVVILELPMGVRYNDFGSSNSGSSNSDSSDTSDKPVRVEEDEHDLADYLVKMRTLGFFPLDLGHVNSGYREDGLVLPQIDMVFGSKWLRDRLQEVMDGRRDP